VSWNTANFAVLAEGHRVLVVSTTVASTAGPITIRDTRDVTNRIGTTTADDAVINYADGDGDSM